MSYKPNDPRSQLGRQLLRNLGERETDERRAAPRFLAPVLHVMIDRQVYQTIDWGLGALVIKDFDKTVAIGATLSVTVSRPEEPENAHRAKVQVLRIETQRKRVTLQFVEVGKGMLGWLGDLQLHGGTPTQS
ncbi:MAG: hypothetical protein JO021_02800 [Alphaproteobacteria bacterium]|nr:hypothetical protein [Alphaproteobacteria bacterium]